MNPFVLAFSQFVVFPHNFDNCQNILKTFVRGSQREPSVIAGTYEINLKAFCNNCEFTCSLRFAIPVKNSCIAFLKTMRDNDSVQRGTKRERP